MISVRVSVEDRYRFGLGFWLGLRLGILVLGLG